MRLLICLGIVGQLLRLFSIAFLVPIPLALYDEHYQAAVRFLISGLTTFVLGALLAQGFARSQRFHRSEAFFVVSMTWLGVASCGAIPYVFYGLSPTEAMFESMSGFTTTGATILQDFSRYDRAFFLWRSVTQWFGGLGVIALFVVVLPRLGIAGRQLFFAEASGAPGEEIAAQVRQGAGRLWLVYSGLTLVLAGLLMGLAEFDWYDSLTHALTTMAAGGFSPNPSSLAGYRNPTAEWVLVPFMILSGTSFPLLYKVFTGQISSFLLDEEFRFYLGSLSAVAVGVGIVLSDGWLDLDALRAGAFQAASLISSTGLASVDYNLWPDSARALLILVMLIGGCAGSAAGGPKAIRLWLVIKHSAREITRTLHPRAVIVLRYKGHAISTDIMRAVFMLVALYFATYFLVGTTLVLLGSDLILGYSAALACVGNIGPAFGPAGPMGNFAGFSGAAKWLLTLGMWVGRLELVAVLGLFHLHVLRSLRLR